MKKKIAITGGIGSGKSTAIAWLKKSGYTIFSCDEIYKEIIETIEYKKEIARQFPEAMVDKSIDRKKLSKIVFEYQEKRRILNAIAHPMIMNRLREYMDACNDFLVFAEVPLLFEGNFENMFDVVLVIDRHEADRIKAVQERDGLKTEEIIKRIQAQFDYYSIEGKARLRACNAYIIYNDASPEQFYQKLSTFAQLL